MVHFEFAIIQYVDALTGDAVLEAIKQERAWELAGEGTRRQDLVRWGDLNSKIIETRNALKDMTDDIRDQGYHVFPNGLIISDSVYTKRHTAAMIGAANIGTTYGTPRDNTNPVLFPGWRGVGDEAKYPGTISNPINSVAQGPPHLLEIKGLFEYLTEDERKDLRSQGYTAEPWAIGFTRSQTNTPLPAGQYSIAVGAVRGAAGNWSGYQEDDFLAGRPARYLCAIPGNVIVATGTDENGNNILVNYYGFPNSP